MKKVITLFILFWFELGCFICGGCSSAQTAEVRLAKKNVDLSTILLDEPSVRSVASGEINGQSGLVIRTTHYVIFTTLTDPLMLRQTPAFLESAFTEYQNQLLQPLRNTEPFKVYLFANRQQWQDFTQTFTGSYAPVYLKIQQGAYVHQGVCVAYDIGRKQTFSVLGHEGWHQFNQQLFQYRLPSWLDEGCATLFETCRFQQGRFVFEPPDNMLRLGTLKYALESNQIISLRQLLTSDPGQYIISANDQAPAIFYAQVYALVRFLREDGYGRRLAAYRRLLQDAVEGRWPLEANLLLIAADRRVALTTDWNATVGSMLFKAYIGEEIENLEREYLKFCSKITHRIMIQLPSQTPEKTKK